MSLVYSNSPVITSTPLADEWGAVEGVGAGDGVATGGETAGGLTAVAPPIGSAGAAAGGNGVDGAPHAASASPIITSTAARPIGHFMVTPQWLVERKPDGSVVQQRIPVRVDVHYLITVWASTFDNEHNLLARTWHYFASPICQPICCRQSQESANAHCHTGSPAQHAAKPGRYLECTG